MRIVGQFATSATSEQLRGIFASPMALATLPTLRDVLRIDIRTLSMLFTPSLGVGPIPLTTTVVTLFENDDCVELSVNARFHSTVVDVALRVEVTETEDGNLLAWTADVAVRGAAASVGQRVISDLAAKAIGDILVPAAEQATLTLDGQAGSLREGTA